MGQKTELIREFKLEAWKSESTEAVAERPVAA